jgi:hypothetical protein
MPDFAFGKRGMDLFLDFHRGSVKTGLRPDNLLFFNGLLSAGAKSQLCSITPGSPWCPSLIQICVDKSRDRAEY